jgi:hypothetical protein
MEAVQAGALGWMEGMTFMAIVGVYLDIQGAWRPYQVELA